MDMQVPSGTLGAAKSSRSLRDLLLPFVRRRAAPVQPTNSLLDSSDAPNIKRCLVQSVVKNKNDVAVVDVVTVDNRKKGLEPVKNLRKVKLFEFLTFVTNSKA